MAFARLLLAAWGQVADPATPRPDCPHCHLPMRHKGSKRGKAITTLGSNANQTFTSVGSAVGTASS